MRNVSSPSPSMDEECHYLNGFVWRQEYLTDVTYPNLIAVTVINSLAVFPTILFNVLVIVAVAKKHRLQTKSNVLVAGLAGTDLLTGLVVQGIEIAVALTRILSDGSFCSLEKANSVALIGSFFLSLGNFVLISIDRYISIKRPLRYSTIVTRQRIETGLLFSWATGLLVTVHELTLAVIDSKTDLYFLYMKVNYTILSVLALVAIGVIGYTYCYIFSESRRQKKRLQNEQLPEEEAKRLKRESKAANTLSVILVTLIITYIPSVVLILVSGYSEDNIAVQRLIVIWNWVVTFTLLGSLCKPIIFFWRVKKLRRAILEILHCRKPENSPPPIEMSKARTRPARPGVEHNNHEASAPP